MRIFGSGYAFAQPTIDAYGNPLTNGQPLIFGVNQEIDLDFNFNLKKLVGQNQWAVDAARAEQSMTGKVKFANFWGQSLLAIMFGQTTNLTAGTLIALNIDTASETIPASGPATITVTPPNSGTFVKDVCVLNAATGKPLTPVTSMPTTGQYSVSAGVYTFATADEGSKVFINYEYSASASALSGSSTLVAQSLPMGATPFFSMQHSVMYQGQQMTWTFPKVTLSKGTFNLKNEGFLIPELDIEIIWDQATNSPFTVSVSQ